jgi:hypothetical protein
MTPAGRSRRVLARLGDETPMSCPSTVVGNMINLLLSISMFDKPAADSLPRVPTHHLPPSLPITLKRRAKEWPAERFHQVSIRLQSGVYVQRHGFFVS